MAELKHCPFCGNLHPILDVYNLDCGTVYQVICNQCGAHGPDYGSNKQQAIDAWNKRS